MKKNVHELTIKIEGKEWTDILDAVFNKKKKDIEVVSGTGENLDISPVYTHIPISKPKIEKKTEKKIVVPKEKKK